MLIGLHDSDRTGFPNLALMKISAWHKARGDIVEWWNPMLTFDRVYSSKIFTFTPENPYLPLDTIKGGTGYGIMDELPEEIDAMFPDYSILSGLQTCNRFFDARLYTPLPLVHRTEKRRADSPLSNVARDQTPGQPGYRFHGQQCFSLRTRT